MQDIFERRNFDGVPDIILNADDSAVALKAITSAHSALGVMYEHIKEKKPLDAEYANNILYMCESYWSDIGKILKIETDSAFERNQRHKQVRAAHERVRELEKQIGSSATPESIQQCIAHMNALISAWWRKFGFGFVSDVKFSRGGCYADFSCHLNGDFLFIDSPTPISDKEAKENWFASLREAGYILTPGRRDQDLVDCDHNREILVRLFAKYAPSAQIQSFVNQRTHKGEILLRSLQVRLPSYDEILSLPIELTESDI